MADEGDFWFDKDGVRRPEKRTGDPWRRYLHGRVDDLADDVATIKGRLEEGDRSMTTMASEIRQHREESHERDRMLAQESAANLAATKRIDANTAQIVQWWNNLKGAFTVGKVLGVGVVFLSTVVIALGVLSYMLRTGFLPVPSGQPAARLEQLPK